MNSHAPHVPNIYSMFDFSAPFEISRDNLHVLALSFPSRLYLLGISTLLCPTFKHGISLSSPFVVLDQILRHTCSYLRGSRLASPNFVSVTLPSFCWSLQEDWSEVLSESIFIFAAACQILIWTPYLLVSDICGGKGAGAKAHRRDGARGRGGNVQGPTTEAKNTTEGC